MCTQRQTTLDQSVHSTENTRRRNAAPVRSSTYVPFQVLSQTTCVRKRNYVRVECRHSYFLDVRTRTRTSIRQRLPSADYIGDQISRLWKRREKDSIWQDVEFWVCVCYWYTDYRGGCQFRGEAMRCDTNESIDTRAYPRREQSHRGQRQLLSPLHTIIPFRASYFSCPQPVSGHALGKAEREG